MKLIRTFLLLVHLAVMVLLFGVYLNKIVPPSRLAFPDLLALAFPALLAVHAMLTLFWIASWRKRAFVFLLLTFFLYHPIIRWINFNRQESGILKVITFNVKNGHRGMDKIQKFFRENRDADVIMLQESSRIALPNQDSVKSPVISLTTRHKIIRHGNLITSGSNGRSFYADIDINGKTIRFVNVYLEPFYIEKDMVKPSESTHINESKARALVHKLVPTFKIHQQQVEEIRNIVRQSPYPVILGGDFNSVPSSWEYDHLGEGLEDAFMKAGSGIATSFHDFKIPIRIDYLFNSKEMEATKYTVDRSRKISDHYPVFAEFKIP